VGINYKETPATLAKIFSPATSAQPSASVRHGRSEGSADVDAGRVAAFAAVETGIVASTSAEPSGIRRARSRAGF
jgi:hypothetical protein